MLHLTGVTVDYGRERALDQVTLEVAERETVCLVGPSGSGKSTLLRVIAGLQPLSAGSIMLDGRDLAHVPAHRRGAGMMFQDYALFPHLNVAGNVAFGLRMRGGHRGDIGARVAELLDVVGLSGFGHRAVAELSGGQQQRVALARALAPAPRVLLLDEPLGSLDRTLRERLVVELRALFARLGITALYVTHDQAEAFAVGDRIGVLIDGRLHQIDVPARVWRRPADETVARFLGLANIASAELHAGCLSTPWGDIPAGHDALDGPLRVLLRPDALRPERDGPIRGTVETVTFAGDHSVVRLRTVSGAALEVSAHWRPDPKVGEQLVLAVDRDGVVLLKAGLAG